MENVINAPLSVRMLGEAEGTEGLPVLVIQFRRRKIAILTAFF